MLSFNETMEFGSKNSSVHTVPGGKISAAYSSALYTRAEDISSSFLAKPTKPSRGKFNKSIPAA